MLVPDELKRYGFQRRLKRIGQIWLDYLQDHVLVLLYRKYPDLIFRGGTCIWKVYKGDRFSEDLDLAIEKIPDGISEYLTKELELLGFKVSVEKERETENMYHLRLGIDRPDTGSTTFLSIEVLKASTPEEEFEEVEVHPPYPDIPRIDIKALTKNTLLAEKISAVCERKRPRDMHDVYKLLKDGAIVDPNLVQKHFKGFTMEEFEESLQKKKKRWKGLKSLIVGELPEFEKEKQYIMDRLQIMFKKDSK